MKREEVDGRVVEELARDICYFYHELADYGGIHSPVVMGWKLRLPYWDFLDTSGYPGFDWMPPELVAFYREGCMVIVFTMARACIEGDAFEIETHLNTCKALTERMIPEDVRQAQLIDALKRALDMVESSEPDHEELNRLSRLVYQECVQRYFADRADSHGTEDRSGDDSEKRWHVRRMIAWARRFFENSKKSENLSFDVVPGEPSRLRLEYIREDVSFYAHSAFTGRGVSICINEVQLFFDDEGYVRSVEGYCPYQGWWETELTPPYYSDGALILTRPDPRSVPSGIAIGLNDGNTRWPVYANPQGWVCLGDPAERGDRAVQFATGCVAVLRGDELVALWLLPTMIDARGTR